MTGRSDAEFRSTATAPGGPNSLILYVGSEMKNERGAVHSDPEIMGGALVFAGTRVPFQTLLDYLEAGHPLGDFLDDFPTVTREQAVAALEQAKLALLARENPA